MTTYLLIAQCLVAAALIAVVTMQVRGGGLGGIFGQPESVYRTRRGVEKSLFQFTVGLTIIFVIICVWIVAIQPKVLTP
jgi:preprotein translocase subunit SecG